MFSILPYSFVFGLYFLFLACKTCILCLPQQERFLPVVPIKTKKQAKNQTNKNKQYTFIAAVPAYCRLIASPLLAHISWKAVLIEEGRIWSGSCLPNFFSWVEKKYVHYKRPNRPTNKRKNEKMNKQRQRDWGTERRGNVRKGEETRWRVNGYMDGQTGNRRTNQRGKGQRVGVTDGRTNAQK